MATTNPTTNSDQEEDKISPHTTITPPSLNNDSSTPSSSSSSNQDDVPKRQKKKFSSSLGPRPVYFPTLLSELLFVFQATAATAMGTFFQGASSIITLSIAETLSMNQGQIAWITASTALTAGAFQLGLGQAADLLGRKTMFLVGMGSFAAFSLLVSFAQNPYWMNVVCGIIGISSAMVVPPAIGIMGAAYGKPSRRKNLAFSAFGAGNPLGFVFGCVISGIITQAAGGNWRWTFIIIAILWTVFTVMGWWTIPKVEAYPDGMKFKERVRSFVKQFDALGTVLTVFGTGVLSAGITLGPSDGWGSGHIIAMLVLGVVLIVGFVFWEMVCRYPLMPPHIWRDRNFTLIILTAVPGQMGFSAANFWLAFFMQQLQRLSPLMVAVHLIPQAVAGLIYNAIAGSILHRVNNTLLLALGSLAYIAANLLLALMKPDSSYWAFIFPALILSVVGADFQFNVANMYVMQSLPSEQQALAGGIFNTLFRLGIAIALGISTAVFESAVGTPAATADPMIPYKKTFLVCVGLSAASFLFLPFVRLGTQGHASVGDLKTAGGVVPIPAVTGDVEAVVGGNGRNPSGEKS